MLDSLDLILGCRDDSVGVLGENILWTLVIQETIKPGEPKCQAPAILAVTKNP